MQTLAAYQLAKLILHIVGTVAPQPDHHLTHMTCQAERTLLLVGHDAVGWHGELSWAWLFALAYHRHEWQGIEHVAKRRDGLFSLGECRVPSAESHAYQFHHHLLCHRLLVYHIQIAGSVYRQQLLVWAASLIVVQGLSEVAASVDVSQVHPQVIVLLDELGILGVISCQLLLHLIKTCLDTIF